MTLNIKTIFNAAEFSDLLESASLPLPVFQHALEHGRSVIRAAHYKKTDATEIVTTHAWLIDQLLVNAWNLHSANLKNTSDATLVAVGGYGRGELHPCSDVDLMLLIKRRSTESDQFVEQFIQFLWDMGLEVGHSTRSLQDCVKESRADITVATNLMESRLLTGNAEMFSEMKRKTDAPKLWPSKKFFSAKLEEQHGRHKRFGDTAYNLEPNIKEGPGGLRDIQIILWVAQRHFHISSLGELVDLKFLSQAEYKILLDGRTFLWQVRNSLHYIAGRREDRLVFDYQRTIAEEFGYSDQHGKLAIEQLMKNYYRTIKELSVVNEILLQHFDESILSSSNIRTKSINDRFNNHGGYLAAKSKNLFSEKPEAILEVFLLLENNPKLKGVRAETIRQLRSNLHRIDNNFRNDSGNRKLFLEIIRQPRGITHELRRMNTYGVLGAYIPDFGAIVGQMQHDLFHVYTVDEHTLFVVRNLRRLSIPEFQHELPFASAIFQRINKPERLYIAGLFHDIAKGRGGDHSDLGSEIVNKFCDDHGISKYDNSLICWLVKNHLLMSWTSQRQDISDPAITNKFAQTVGDQEHLDNLYLLTVADMRGTSPKIWNDWKGNLLIQLYNETSRLFSIGIDTEIDVNQHVNRRKSGAIELLNLPQKNKPLLDNYWSGLENSYFLGYEPNSLAWHAKTIITKSAAEIPLVATRYNPKVGGTEFLFYSSFSADVLIRLTGAFDEQNLSIVDARINTSRLGFMLTTFVVLDSNSQAIKNPSTLSGLEDIFLQQLLKKDFEPRLASSHLSRQLKHFPIETQINFDKTANGLNTIMLVVAQDRPGLLYQVVSALYLCKIKLVKAKISTIGERAEDVFFITDLNDEPITDKDQLDSLKDAIYSRLQIQESNAKVISF